MTERSSSGPLAGALVVGPSRVGLPEHTAPPRPSRHDDGILRRLDDGRRR